MKFTIVTPTRNALDNLKRCIGSVRGQTGVEVEHIIQDACSSDGTPAWLASQPDLLARTEPDTGMYDAINRGWSVASGDIYAWLNSDEQYLPGTLEMVSKIFERYPEVDYVRGHAIIVNGEGLAIATRREIRLSKLYICNSFLNTYSCTLFFRKALWDEGLIHLDEKYRYAADMEMVLRLLHADKRYFYIDNYLSLFAFDGSNLSCHQQMLDETADVQSRHGGSHLKAVRMGITVCRYVERLFTGSYRKVRIDYDYALNEIPTYKHFTVESVPGSYRTRE